MSTRARSASIPASCRKRAEGVRGSDMCRMRVVLLQVCLQLFEIGHGATSGGVIQRVQPKPTQLKKPPYSAKTVRGRAATFHPFPHVLLRGKCLIGWNP